MPKYVGNIAKATPDRDFGEKLSIASQGISQALQTYSQIKKAEEAQAVISNPNSSPIQKAMALSSIGQEKLGTEVFKKAANESVLSGIEQRLNQNLGRTPNIRPNEPVQRTTTTAVEAPSEVAQPGFSVSGPQRAAQNAMAVNQPREPIPIEQQQIEGQPAPQQIPQQMQQQVNPELEAQAFEQAAQEAAMVGNSPVATQYANRANQIRKDVRAAQVEEKKDAREAVKMAQQEEFEERKENASYRQKILNGIPQTKKLKAQIGRIEKLSEKAELTPGAVKALNFFGIPIGAFDTANAQELEKLSNDLTATITSEYGNRILATEFNTFLKRIPTLLNSTQGRERIIRNMKLYSDAAEAEQNAYQDIYKMQKQSGIKHPIVKQEDVLEISEPKLDKIFEQLNSELMEDSGTKEKAKLLPPSAQGTVRMSKNGRFYDFPAEQAQLRKKEGFAPL